MNTNALLIEQAKPVVGLSNTTPTASTPDYVSLKNFEKLTIIILALNATTVTGSAITVKQATDVAFSQDGLEIAFVAGGDIAALVRDRGTRCGQRHGGQQGNDD